MNQQVSACRYLFRAEPSEVFGSKKSAALINESLEIMMQVNHHLMKKKAYVLIDPMATNDQCHLYALKTALIMRSYMVISEENRLARSEDNRFLHLSFFLSYAIFSDARDAIALFQKAMKEMNIRSSTPKAFTQFLRDEGFPRRNAARKALNDYFKEDLQRSVKDHPELSKLASENLVNVINNNSLYTFPKFAGVTYFVDAIEKEQVPFVIKVKVLSKRGAASEIMVAPSRAIQDEEPVVVFETYASEDGLTVPGIRQEAQKCHQYFRAMIEKNKLHATPYCFFCNKESMDLSPFRSRLEQVMQRPKEMLYALGADFTHKMQEKYEPYLQDAEKYPELAQNYQKSLGLIEDLGLDMNSPRTFSVSHVYADIGKVAKTGFFQFAVSRQEFLESRGLV
jgi:hypothetical protein